MARYHVNPATGNPGRCRAQVRCRFQEEGAPPVEHYATREEAQEAYGARQEKTPPPLRKLQPWDVRRGELMQEGAEALARMTVAEREASPRFAAVGLGSEYSVWHDRHLGLVYKLRAGELGDKPVDDLSPAELKDMQSDIRGHQEAYLSFSAELLRQEGAEYVPTYFLNVNHPSGEAVPVMAQSYLSPQDYYEHDDRRSEPPPGDEAPYWEAKAMKRKWPKWETAGLVDIHSGNYRIRRGDNTVVFLDCLHYDGLDHAES